MNNKTRILTEGAMMVAIVGALILIDRGMAGVLIGFIFFMMPLPMVVYASKYGLKTSLVPFVCIIIVGLIFGYDAWNKIEVVTMSSLGLVYGYGVKNKKSNLWLLVASTLVAIVDLMATEVILPKIMGYTADSYTEIINMMLETFRLEGQDAEILAKVMRNLVPIATIITAFFEAVINHILSSVLLRKLRIETVPFGKIEIIQIPKPIAWVLFALLVFCSISNKLGWFSEYDDILMTINAVVVMVFVMDGYLAMCMIARMTGRKYLALLAVVFIFFAYFILEVFGIFDSVTNLREVMLENSTNGQQKN